MCWVLCFSEPSTEFQFWHRFHNLSAKSVLIISDIYVGKNYISVSLSVSFSLSPPLSLSLSLSMYIYIYIYIYIYPHTHTHIYIYIFLSCYNVSFDSCIRRYTFAPTDQRNDPTSLRETIKRKGRLEMETKNCEILAGISANPDRYSAGVLNRGKYPVASTKYKMDWSVASWICQFPLPSAFTQKSCCRLLAMEFWQVRSSWLPASFYWQFDNDLFVQHDLRNKQEFIFFLINKSNYPYVREVELHSGC